MADDLLQRLLAATDPAEKAALVARSVLANEEPVLAELVPVLAFLRWFDESVVAALLPESEDPRSAELFTRLTELPFVERVSYGFALHDLTRQGLLAEATAEQRLAAAQAADAYAQKDDFENLLEGLYCTVLGEQSKAAQMGLENSLYVVAAYREPWGNLLSLFASLHEAESLVGHEVVERTPWYWLVQGLARFMLVDLTGALAYFDRAIQLNPEDANYFIIRGLVRAALGEKQAAIADFDLSIALNPKYALAYKNRGLARAALGKHLAAITDYDRAIQLFPDGNDRATAYYNRGIARAELGEHLAAIADFDSALALNPQDATAYHNRGNARSALGEHQAAIADYDRAIDLFPDGKDKAFAYRNRGNARGNLGEHLAAIADYDSAIALNPQEATAYYNWIAHSILGDARRALVEYQAAIADYDQVTGPDSGNRPGDDENTRDVGNRGTETAKLKTDSYQAIQMPNWQPNWNNVRWDWGASDAAASALRRAADQLDQSIWERQWLAGQAQIDLQGHYRDEFDDRLARLVSQARGLAAELRQAADRIQFAANRAYDEQRRRESERQRWQEEKKDKERREQKRRGR